MIVRVLGSAAGGGFPQWNCNCRNCGAVRAGRDNVIARTQTSIAVSSDGAAWTLLDATPDLRAQLAASPRLQPREDDAARSSPIKAVVLSGFEIDQIAGLLSLREGQKFRLHATSFVLTSLQENRIFGALASSCVDRHAIHTNIAFEPFEGAGIEITPISMAGKVPFHHADAKAPASGGEVVGVVARDIGSGRRLAYIPCCAAVTGSLLRSLDGVDVLFFDGTLYTDRELVEQRLSDKTGSTMGHISMSGPRGSIESLRELTTSRRIFIHLNNSNPVLRNDSREREFVSAAGWEIAHDGMELTL